MNTNVNTNSQSDIDTVRSEFPLKNIEEEFSNKLTSDFGLECYFHFTRPLLVENEYNNIDFSITFKKVFYIYEEYKKEWDNTYWHYSFQMKMHQLLRLLLKEDFYNIIDCNDEPFYDYIEKRIYCMLNCSEKQYFNIITKINKCSVSACTVSWYKYRDLWEANKYEPHNLVELLKNDLLNRKSESIYGVYHSYGGVWNSLYASVVEEFNQKM